MQHIIVVSVADLLSFQVLDHEISSWQCMRGVSFESLYELRYVGKGHTQRASVEENILIPITPPKAKQ